MLWSFCGVQTLAPPEAVTVAFFWYRNPVTLFAWVNFCWKLGNLGVLQQLCMIIGQVLWLVCFFSSVRFHFLHCIWLLLSLLGVPQSQCLGSWKFSLGQHRLVFTHWWSELVLKLPGKQDSHVLPGMCAVGVCSSLSTCRQCEGPDHSPEISALTYRNWGLPLDYLADLEMQQWSLIIGEGDRKHPSKRNSGVIWPQKRRQALKWTECQV